MYTRILTKLRNSLDNYIGVTHLEGLYFGNDCDQNFFTHFDFTNYLEHFLSEVISEIVAPDTLFIIGNINLNQIPDVKAAYDKLVGPKKYVIHMRSSIQDEFLEKSYFVCHDLSEIVPVDLVYNQFPYDLAEFVEQVKQLKQQGISA